MRGRCLVNSCYRDFRVFRLIRHPAPLSPLDLIVSRFSLHVSAYVDYTFNFSGRALRGGGSNVNRPRIQSKFVSHR